jgi:hypothetical protein
LSDPIAPDRTDFTYGGATCLVEQEIEHLRKWRGVDCEGKSLQKDVLRAGLALSGGGIRSASFSLGILQALAHAGWLPKFDYLSTVSGGGYIGSSLTYLLHRKWEAGAAPHAAPAKPAAPAQPAQSTQPIVFGVSRDSFPYQSFPMVDVAPDAGQEEAAHIKGRLLRILRQNAKYLTPGGGITVLSMLGVLLRNSLLSLLVHFGLLVLCFDALRIATLVPERNRAATGANRALCAALIALGIYGLFSLAYAVATRGFDWVGATNPTLNYRLRRAYEIACTGLFSAALGFLVVGAVPWVDLLLSRSQLLPWSTVSAAIAGASSVLGLITALAAHFKSSGAQKPRAPIGMLVALGSALLVFGLLILAYEASALSEAPIALPPPLGMATTVACACLIAVFLFGWVPHVNYLSLHRYYRDRLMETFMPDVRKVTTPGEDLSPGMTSTGNVAMLGTVCGAHREMLDEAVRRDPKSFENGPYHIINANVVLVGSKTPKYRGRGGDNFILSPIFWGSTATGWTHTDPRTEQGLTLATAMAISGAAINPDAACGGEGLTRQAGLSTLMGILNIRLGYWLHNPGKRRVSTDGGASFAPALRNKPNLIWPGLAELFGRLFYLNEDREYVLLTDGGHFENLGLYELVRRRLKVIVVCDGSADPTYTFSDLANAIEKVRADFGAIVAIDDRDLQPMVPRPRQGAPSDSDSAGQRVAQRGYLFATIRYARTDRKDVNTFGLLIYLNSTFFEGLSADLYGYRNTHPSFPDEPTSDQFFDEKQFEAYRELGYNTARAMMAAATADDRRLDALVDPDALKALREIGFPPVPPAS